MEWRELQILNRAIMTFVLYMVEPDSTKIFLLFHNKISTASFPWELY